MKSPYSSHIFSFNGRSKNVIVLLYYLQPKKKIIKIGQIIMNNPIRIGIVTVSDRASLGVYQDLGGPAINNLLHEILSCNFETIAKIIPDEQPLIESTLKELCDVEKCCLVVTTGGTGPAKRDVTPEATEAVCDKILDGFGEQMRAISLKIVPTAILSRQIAGIRGSSLIINLPGKPSAIRDCLLAVFPAIPYCIDLIDGPYLTTNESIVLAFRPKKK
jgi:molybdopterin adenylyltransferase